MSPKSRNPRHDRSELPMREKLSFGGWEPANDTTEAAEDQLWEQDWQRNLLQLCFDKVRQGIDPKTFQAFQLYALEGWTPKETAEFLKMTIDSDYAAKSRVTQRIRRWFERELSEDELT